jgi:hypothetical protein
LGLRSVARMWHEQSSSNAHESVAPISRSRRTPSARRSTGSRWQGSDAQPAAVKPKKERSNVGCQEPQESALNGIHALGLRPGMAFASKRPATFGRELLKPLRTRTDSRRGCCRGSACARFARSVPHDEGLYAERNRSGIERQNGRGDQND